jgi:hypothetical protein
MPDEIVAVPAGGPPAEAPPAVAANDAAMPASVVEPPAGIPADIPASGALGPPDHLIRHETLQEAFAAYQERTRGYETWGEALDAHNARRRDNSARLEAWMNGAGQ